MKIHKAFTLLELLVVIGIIGILVALATVSYSAAQKGGRDARRKQDLVAIQNALEQYYSENTFKYPDSCSYNYLGIYMKSAWPMDPDGVTDYTASGTCDATGYCVCAVMDTPTSGNSGGNCNWASVEKTHYCVGNLQ